MAKQTGDTGRTPRKGNISLAPLTGDQAMAALLRVKPADVRKVEEQEKAGKAKGGKKRGRK
jgi:hypothetical protein